MSFRLPKAQLLSILLSNDNRIERKTPIYPAVEKPKPSSMLCLGDLRRSQMQVGATTTNDADNDNDRKLTKSEKYAAERAVTKAAFDEWLDKLEKRLPDVVRASHLASLMPPEFSGFGARTRLIVLLGLACARRNWTRRETSNEGAFWFVRKAQKFKKLPVSELAELCADQTHPNRKASKTRQGQYTRCGADNDNLNG